MTPTRRRCPRTPVDELVITAHGTPVTQGSIRSLGAGRPSVHTNAKRLKPWRTTVHEAALTELAHRRVSSAPTARSRCGSSSASTGPLGTSRTGRNAGLLKDNAPASPATRGSGDVDKLARAVLDALTDAGVWKDDSQVVDLRARKAWVGDEGALSKPGAVIVVRRLAP